MKRGGWRREMSFRISSPIYQKVPTEHLNERLQCTYHTLYTTHHFVMADFWLEGMRVPIQTRLGKQIYVTTVINALEVCYHHHLQYNNSFYCDKIWESGTEAISW